MAGKYWHICLVLFLMNCKSDDPIPDIYTGTASAICNNNEWSALSYTQVTEGGFVIAFDIYNEMGFLRESLSISNLNAVYEEQHIVSTIFNMSDEQYASYSTVKDDGDVLGDLYLLDTTSTNNIIHVTSYDPRKSNIKGTFNLRFILYRDDGEGEPAPEIKEFINGVFKVKVEDGLFL